MAAILRHYFVEPPKPPVRHAPAASEALDDVILYSPHHGNVLRKHNGLYDFELKSGSADGGTT